MDVEYETISENFPESNLTDEANNGSLTNHSIMPPICSLCRMTPSTDSYTSINSGTVGVCGHCKFLLFEDLNIPTDELRRIRLHRGRRSITGSSESTEDFFSHEFSQMMNLARHDQLLVPEQYDPSGDSDVIPRLVQRTSSRSTPDGSRRWRRMSDTESDWFDNESNVSFGARMFQGDSDTVSVSMYGGDSDLSYEDHSFLEIETFPQSIERGEFESDSDIDPMHTGLITWESDGHDDIEEEYGSEDVGSDRVTRYPSGTGLGLSGGSPIHVIRILRESDAEEEYGSEEDVGSDRVTRYPSGTGPGLSSGSPIHVIRILRESDAEEEYGSEEDLGSDRVTRYPSGTGPGSSGGSPVHVRRNRFIGLEQIIRLRIRERDHLTMRGFEGLLGHLNSENESSRRGAPPASESFVNSLPRVTINENQKKSDEITCAVCKDPLSVGIEAIQLPCLHLYHPCCILPWLARRNSCPLCRYELPTNMDYVVGSHSTNTRTQNPTEIHEFQQQEDSSSDDDVDDSMNTEIIEAGGEIQQELVKLRNAMDNTNGGRGRWSFLVAAPVVSILGIALVLWLGKPQRISESMFLDPSQASSFRPENNQQQNRRWWNWF